MHIIQSNSTRTRRAAVAAALCLLSACGGDRAEDTQSGAAAADPAAADTSAMGMARRALGPEVAMALGFRIPNRDPRFVAAALPVMEWVPDVARSGSNVAPGGFELVIVEVTPESHAVHKPGLYASREPFLPRLDDTATAPPADSATLSRMMGVEDVDGDGTPEVWAAQYTASPDGGHTWDLRAYDRNSRTMYQASAAYGSVAGGEGTRQTFSASVDQNPATRPWLTDRLMRLEAARPGVAAGR
ncbi:hypothetical protein [Longimicrobium sp.]|uniref:hypothetical protein n=1 Tax=Longimicrobium sp. TaxID=2029185 RepID=UPI003B3AFDA3